MHGSCGQGVEAVPAGSRPGPVPAEGTAGAAAAGTVPTFPAAAVRTLTRRGRLVHLYGRQHIDLQRVAGALCRG
ncbi:putative leader peptide [Actinacidiphila guanduensis]|uniref:putative leader peptide n=1 Tax=Actinacidiphila guanduensis TaxID=310781 RepID=UPI003899685C